jgi:hypothetical protein
MAGFLNRWSKRKAGLESSEPSRDDAQHDSKLTQTPSELHASVSEHQSSDLTSAQVSQQEQMPTLEDVLKLTKDSDYSAYVKPGIDPDVQQAALQKLFSDPRYNVMDGLDIYIDDYSKPDPIPLEMLKRLNQSQLLGLFKTPEEKIADIESERIEKEQYENRLQALNARELSRQEQQVQNALPDETPSDVNNTNSVNSLESNKTQEEVGSNQSKPADSAS